MAKNKDKGGLNGLPSDKNKKKDGESNKSTVKAIEDIVHKKGGSIKKDPEKGYNKGRDKGVDEKGKPLSQPHDKKFQGSGGGKGKGKGGGGPSGKGDINEQMFAWQKKQAEQAREDEKKRKEKIEKGMAKIDAAYAGFNPEFYAGREQKYKDYYMGQLQPEFTKARENLTFALSRAGLLQTAGTEGSKAQTIKTAENETDISNKIGQVGANAASNTVKMQEAVDAQKSNLINQLNQTAAANQVGDQATASATNLASAAPDYNWTPDVFFGAAQGVGGMVQAAQNAQYNNIFNNGGSGSGVRTGGTTIR